MKKIKFREKKDRLIIFLDKNKRRISWITFLVGFLVDIFTLNRIDALYGNLVLAFYLFFALFLIILINWGDYRGVKNKLLFKIYQYSPYALQFSYGALFSGFVIYYTTSASLYVSWPFLLILYLFFVLNEKFEKFYEKFEFQIMIFFMSFYSFTIFFLPIIIKKVSDKIFIASGVLSILFIFWTLKFIFKIIPALKKKIWKIIRNIFIVFFIFNLSYFYNIIPPVPLSAKNMKVAHWAGRNEEGKYSIITEVRKWNSFYDKFFDVYHKRDGEKVYFFVSVFAPTDLKTKIIHNWYYFDSQRKEWELIQKVPYQIIGGRSGGYRGYSYLTNPRDGKWRVDVTNNSGLLIVRKKFEVQTTSKNLDLKIKVFK